MLDRSIQGDCPITFTIKHVILAGKCEDAELDGYKDPIDAPSYTESIDRDQAVDDNGKAIYDRYKLIVDTTMADDPGYDWHNYSFSADDIEEFAKTW